MKHFGFTFIEMIIVLAIIVSIAVLAIGSIKNSQDNYSLSAAGEDILSVLRSARSKTLASQDASQYGVHFMQDRAVVFKGQTYVDGSTSNKISFLPLRITISSINLGGPVDVVFSRLTGVPSVTGTVVISLKSNGSKSRTISVSSSGMSYLQ